jgi:hypothetical protein
MDDHMQKIALLKKIVKISKDGKNGQTRVSMLKKEAPKDRSLDQNTINENLITIETSSYW